MLQPKRVKYRKSHKGHRRGMAKGGTVIEHGEYALQATSTAWITARQIEAARRAIVHYVRRGGKIWIRVFPDKPVTKKPAETRMGSGKGPMDHWVAVVNRGRILFEISGVTFDQAKEAMRLAGHKLPLSTQFIERTQETVEEAAGDEN
ncbi:MAG: 50S ribosomal protein L16 [Dehalococcoidales bacterium]|mgnify:CR=1 FL=1|nr:50S ribosomal protein L16 [Dehalococcoidales bacterium]MDD3264469.1 50S ribosomal protein L16 [Dehalococcoidales bacterium]MDD4322000.1 50S ribosomal protein L16 [Dehalococcoidales bacterium]MDD4793907.1 50S ribosomal protein L16 [Dehalococcoidales bacterium]MDD5122087.1 50S ribosomal protein L16 [Dehalococcoidales bacterium]